MVLLGILIAVTASAVAWRRFGRAEKAARESREILRVTLASIGDAVITTDTKGCVTSLNSVAEALTGWKSDEAKGVSLASVFQVVNENNRQVVDNPATRALREGLVVGLANHSVLIARDGTERPVDDSAAPIRDADGNVIGCILIFRDVTERRKTERAVSESEKRKAAILETALDCIITIDHEGKILDFNPAAERTFGYARAHVLGEEMSDLIIPPALRQQHRQGMAQYLATGVGPVLNKRLEMTAIRADGTEFPIELTITRISGEPAVFTGYVRDITERKALENRLRQLVAQLSETDRRKNEFLAMLAHELRNPLAPISNAVEILRLSDGKETSVLPATDMMHRQLRQMVHLIDDLLDVSRISQGKIELRRTTMDLASAVSHAVEASRSRFEESGLTLIVNVPPKPIYLNADPTRIAQVIGNLLNNAVKFTPSGQVWLTVEREKGQALIRVRDTGIGIAADHLEHVFDLFMQADTTLERTQSGLGIGLALAKSLVEHHGGTISAHSPGPGQGAEFVVCLPVLLELPKSVSSSEAAHEARAVRRKILVVDDNHDSAQSLATLLEIHGHEVRMAHDGLEAVDATAIFRPDVVLLDIGLPRMNGYDAGRRIREMPFGRGILLVALTGWGQEADRIRSAEAGFDAHLVKPVDHDELARLLSDSDPTGVTR